MRPSPALLASLAASSLLALAPVSLAKGGGNDRDVIASAKCSKASTAKLKLSPENGRLEAELEVDQNRNGRVWTWTLGARSGVAVTMAPSGSFEVRRLLGRAAGAATVVATARNNTTGETCRVSATATF